MKIGFDAKRLFRNFTGLGNYSRTLVGNLSEQCPANDYHLMAERVVENDETVAFLDPVYHIVRPTKCRRTWRSWGMSGDIKRLGLDVYHGLSHDLPFGIKSSGARSVVTIHDVCYKTFPKMFPLVERIIYSIKYRHSVRASDRIIAISESTKRDVVKYFNVDPDKVEVIYQALNPVFYTPIDRDQAVRMVAHYGIHGDFVLYVGSINSRKNLLGIVEAYARITPEKRLPLVVVGGGSGAYVQKCWAAIETHGLVVKRIENLSSMSVLRDLYIAAKFMVYPSFYEGFGLPVTEALLSECPVITSDVSSLPEAGGAHALYVDPTDTTQLTAAIERLLDMPLTERAELAASGRLWASQTFDPTRLTAQVEALYRHITTRNK